MPFTWKKTGNSGWKIKWFHRSVWNGSENMGMILGNTIFLLFLVCSVDFDTTFRRVVSHHVKVYSFIFMHKILTRVVLRKWPGMSASSP